MRFSTDAEGNPIEQPVTYEARVAMAAKTIEEAGLLMPVLVDRIDNPLYCSYGQMPNNAYLIGMDGRVILYQDWNKPNKMEEAILDYFGDLE